MRFFLLVYQYCPHEVAELTNTINHIICFAIKIRSTTSDISLKIGAKLQKIFE